MGNTAGRKTTNLPLTAEEHKRLLETFKKAAKGSSKLKYDDLVKFWSNQMDPRFFRFLTNFLYGSGKGKQAFIEYDKFAELYVYIVKGTIDEQVQTFYSLLDIPMDNPVPYKLIKEYCESLASTFTMKTIRLFTNGYWAYWMKKGFVARTSNVQALGEGLAFTVFMDEDVKETASSFLIRKWLQDNTLHHTLMENVFIYIFGLPKKGKNTEGIAVPRLYPKPIGIDSMPDYPAFTDLTHILVINNYLPSDQRIIWRFLFSTLIHGESFSTLMGRLVEQGPCVIIIKDTHDYIFGGYCSQSFSAGPNFHGTDASFLFQLSPHVRVYQASGYNNHYQYLNVHQKAMPNGLIMGGQLDYGGLHLFDEFGIGTTAETCSTYRGYKMLSKEKNFKVACMEIWAVGEKPLSIKASERGRSVLDSNNEAKAILELAGRKHYSDGLREPED